MNKVIFGFMIGVYVLMYMSYINRPPTELELYCQHFYKNIYDEKIQEPLMLLIKGTCDG